jgi:hypothetical protein
LHLAALGATIGARRINRGGISMRIVIAGLLGGIVMFFWGAVAHMALPLGEMGMKVAPDSAQEALLAAGKQFDQGEGIYMVPMMDMEKFKDEAAAKAFGERQLANPYAFVVWQPSGVGSVINMGPFLIKQFVSDTVSALLLAFIASLAMGFGQRVTVCGVAGLFSWTTMAVPYWNWYRFPLDFTLAAGIEQVVGWVLAGFAMAWWLGRGGR